MRDMLHILQRIESFERSMPVPAGTLIGSDYTPLRAVLDAAFEQAKNGKGVIRHGEGKKFNDQIIMSYPRERDSLEGPLYQIRKKSEEAVGAHKRSEDDVAIRNLHGVIIYAATMVLHIQEKQNGSKEEDDQVGERQEGQ